MSTKLKLYIGRKVIDSLTKSTNLTPIQLLPLIQIGRTRPNNNLELNVPLKVVEDQLGVTNVNEILKIQPDDIIKSIEVKKDRANRKISFEIERGIFVKDVIENGARPDLNLNPKKIVVDFSSPNIAKPFHVGHLRSTIIGNFIGNLNTFMSNKVTKLNYLGDWGTQFGLIKIGVDDLKYSEGDIKENPLELLYQSYVHANKLAEKDPNILEKARVEFSRLEREDQGAKYWRDYVNYSKIELESTYKRLGVTFDEYDFESMYNAKQIQNIIDVLLQKSIAQKESDGKITAQVNDKQKVSVVKSDGSSLYLTRDIAAAIDRFERFQFDRMFYVVENGQNDHFNALKSILHRMEYSWSDRLQHVKFGRIHGMSTRKGTAVFLRDILDECRELMAKKQLESPTTKVPISENISDILGVSCVIINDLKQRRQRDYEFTWEKVLQAQGDTGIKLQYTHCRLCSLEKNSGAVIAKECAPEMVDDPEVTNLIQELARFQEILNRSKDQLEACILVTYLFHLCNHINKLLKVLQVKGVDSDVASQRLLIFHTARQVLGEGMTILGLQPLTEM